MDRQKTNRPSATPRHPNEDDLGDASGARAQMLVASGSRGALGLGVPHADQITQSALSHLDPCFRAAGYPLRAVRRVGLYRTLEE